MRWRGTTMQNFIIFKKLNMMKLFKISLLWSTCQEISDFQNLAPPISFYTPAWGLNSPGHLFQKISIYSC